MNIIAPVLGVLSFFFYVVLVSGGQITPSIAYSLQEKVVQVGESFELQCSLSNVQNFHVLWYKVDRADPSKMTMLSSGLNLTIQNNRLSLKTDPFQSTPSLRIKKAQQTDEGRYRCQVLLPNNQNISKDVNVIVHFPPIIFENSTKSVVVREGRSVRLECYAGGNPKPKMYWISDNHSILPTESSQNGENFLTISNINKNDHGTYICLAENGIGEGKRRNVQVEVEYAPIVSVRRQKLGQALTFDMDLECEISAYPEPRITWWKDGVQIINNEHYNILNYESNSVSESKLRITDVNIQNYGRYECRASNEFGRNQSFVDFVETKDPVCPPACDSPAASAASSLYHNIHSWFFFTGFACFLHVLQLKAADTFNDEFGV